MTLTRRSMIAALACLLAVPIATAAAEGASPFDAKAFAAAQAAGKTILIDVTAPWCPVCRRQQPILRSIEKENPKLVVLEVDFDTAKDVLKRFRVTQQSTLIVFKGTSEVGRSTGDTDPARIRRLVAGGF
ncbi:MAG: thioredoxin family protein [Xanthobacteraceae bacterium]|nr:thioredoxin family protein [Xanthobacteraceae bacterium]